MSRNRLNKFEELIEQAPYCFAHASESITPNNDFTLIKGADLSITDSSGNDVINTQGDVLLKFLPDPRLVILISMDLKLGFENEKQGSILTVNTLGLRFRCRVTNVATSTLNDSNVVLSSVDGSTLHNKVSNLSYVTFYVINFPESFGSSVRGRNNPNFSWRSRLTLSDDIWQIQMDKVEDYKSIFKELNAKDGYAFTYAGKIERIDGSLFNSDELLQELDKVCNLFSFARGANAKPFCLHGYDNNDTLLWRDWTLRRCDRWTLTQENWFCDQHSIEQLSKLYLGWSTLFEDELWKIELPKVLYWYCYAGRNAKGAGTDGSLILAIAALELFSFNYLVRKTNLRSKKKFDQKHLSNNVYKTLKKLKVPVELPKELERLHSYSIDKDWQTGPKAIVEIRNEIVHPDRESSPGSHVCYEALQLALWYIELLILRLSNYDGLYSNRIRQPKWKGDVEKVPFSSDG